MKGAERLWVLWIDCALGAISTNCSNCDIRLKLLFIVPDFRDQVRIAIIVVVASKKWHEYSKYETRTDVLPTLGALLNEAL